MSQSGFSLIELLVAVVVFSVGLLAVAGLQTVSKGSSFESLQRTTASHIAHGMLEDMRTNGGAMFVYTGSGELGNSQFAAEPDPSCTTAGVECTADEKANHDLWFWESVLDGAQVVGADGPVGGIVSPSLCIDGPVGNGAGIYTVSIAWRGVISMQSANPEACGSGSAEYGGTDEFRRIIAVSTFIDPTM